MDTIIIILLIVVLAELTYMLARNQNKPITQDGSQPIFVDTSVLIDGRIIAIAQSGFIGDTLVIPRSVVGELQFLADNSDHEKRARARHGLDVIAELQAMPGVKVEILQDGSKAEEGVDERLLNLAKKHGGAICTIDFNLNKVAQVENLRVLNVNELAQSLRMSFLPGEQTKLELTQKGQDSHQAVGYLADGTMVVVEHAAKQIGQAAEIEFIRSLQTAAGKMMFAKLIEAPKKKESSEPRRPVAKTAGRKQVKPAAQPQPKPERPPVQKPTPPEKKPQSKRRTPRPKTSAQREAAFIDLVNNQDQ